jgi:hypothetical protein
MVPKCLNHVDEKTTLNNPRSTHPDFESSEYQMFYGDIGARSYNKNAN